MAGNCRKVPLSRKVSNVSRKQDPRASTDALRRKSFSKKPDIGVLGLIKE